MMDFDGEQLLSTILGLAVLGMVLFGKLSELRFRRTAVVVTGTVIKRFPRQRYTSYYLAYMLEGVQRVAEYCEPPLRKRFQEGDELQILIDPSHPPDTEVPDSVSHTGSGAGNCSLVGEPLFGVWDAVYTVVALALLLHAHWP